MYSGLYFTCSIVLKHGSIQCAHQLLHYHHHWFNGCRKTWLCVILRSFKDVREQYLVFYHSATYRV